MDGRMEFRIHGDGTLIPSTFTRSISGGLPVRCCNTLGTAEGDEEYRYGDVSTARRGIWSARAEREGKS